MHGVNFLSVLSSNQTLLADFIKLALGNQHSMILKQDGSVWSTGIILRGLLPSRVVGKHFLQVIPRDAKAMAAGAAHSMVLKQDGSIWATGRNYLGQLGDGTNIRKHEFSLVHLIPGAKAVAAGGGHSMILTHDGLVWATGSNKYGQFGDGLPVSYKTFVEIAPLGNGSRYCHIYHDSILVSSHSFKHDILHFPRSVPLAYMSV